MTEIRETAYNQTAETKTAQVTTNEHSWIIKLLKLASLHPTETQIIKHPDDNYGYLLINVPKSWFKISPPKKRVMTDEQRAAASERMKKMLTSKLNKLEE